MILVPAQPKVSHPDPGACVASRENSPAYWSYGTLWVIAIHSSPAFLSTSIDADAEDR